MAYQSPNSRPSPKQPSDSATRSGSRLAQTGTYRSESCGTRVDVHADCLTWAPFRYDADGRETMPLQWGDFGGGPGRKRSARFMPRWASRITLEIVSVRPERVQDITEEDARREGVPTCCANPMCHCATPYRHGFQMTWDAINAKRGHGFDKNGWVWRIEFKRV